MQLLKGKVASYDVACMRTRWQQKSVSWRKRAGRLLNLGKQARKLLKYNYSPARLAASNASQVMLKKLELVSLRYFATGAL